MDSQTTWAQPFGDFNHRWLVALFRPIRPAKDFLNGTLLGHMVSRHAFRGAGTKWIRLELETPSEDLPEGVPTKAKLGINNLVLVRVGETVHALHEQCAHAGGPLSQGTVVDGCIECPWHGSRYRLANGHLARGPSVYDQPRYQLRPAE